MPKPVPRERKHKRRRLIDNAGAPDSNAFEIPVSDANGKSAPRGHIPARTTGKKTRRLEKYLETKLKHDQSIELIRKLSRSKIDTSLFRSSKNLRQKSKSRSEDLAPFLDAPPARYDIEQIASRPVDIVQPNEDNLIRPSAQDGNPSLSEKSSIASNLAKTVKVGSGLKRPLAKDEEGRPILKRRVRALKHFSSTVPVWSEDHDSTEFEGFSSASENDILSLHSADGSNIDFDESSQDGNLAEQNSSRASSFKAWATQNRNFALGFTPVSHQNALTSENNISEGCGPETTASITRSVADVQKFSNSVILSPTATVADNRRYHVTVSREPSVMESRLALPIVAEEQLIMETIHTNDCTIICGATGSGKTTQVPQFLFEYGYGNSNGPVPGMIGITQPRRVAALSMAARVAHELGSAFTNRVSHKIRFDSSVGKTTAIKFMTDGVLLREISSDFLLSEYSAIVIDEAHERSVNTDILIGCLTRIVAMRAASAPQRPLKLIIMSATLRIDELMKNKQLFPKHEPPVVNVEGSQYSVLEHFSRRTRHDYVEEMFEKVSRGHRKLPAGGILAFLTGKNEIALLAKRLQEIFPSTYSNVSYPDVHVSAEKESLETEDFDVGAKQFGEEGLDTDDEIAITGVDNDLEEIEYDIGEEPPNADLKIHVLPLYSQMPQRDQARIFEPSPAGSRMIVLATNVAETSITIPGIRYVFDCGRSKERRIDPITGVQSFVIDWISKASADQRKGRAGRTQSGHCYRMYSSAVYNRDFKDFTEPEILRTPIESIVLQLKSMGVPNVSNFPFPTHPGRHRLGDAEKLLRNLGAISGDSLTQEGKALAKYPLSPRLARILVIGRSQNVMSYAIALVSVLSVPELFMTEAMIESNLGDENNSQFQDVTTDADKIARRKRIQSFRSYVMRLDATCDAMKFLAAICIPKDGPLKGFPISDYLNPKLFEEARQLRQQLARLAGGPENGYILDPSKQQVQLLRQIVAAGYIDRIAIRADLAPEASVEAPHRKTRSDRVPYLTLMPSKLSSPGSTSDISDTYVFIHPSSLITRISAPKLPQFIIYSHLSESSMSSHKRRIRLHPLTTLNGAQIAALAANSPLLAESKPVGHIEMLPRGQDGSERREVWVLPLLQGNPQLHAWPLPPARKVRQVRSAKRGWITEAAVD